MQLLILGRMMQISLTIDGLKLEVEEGLTILEAAQRAGIYIPALCYHPDLPPFDSVIPSNIVYQGSFRIEGTSEGYEGCQLCLVEVEGDGIKTSCNTPVKEGMIVHTKTQEIVERRQKILAKILSKHPHACLLCPQKEGCDLKHCISNVPEDERCCSKFNNCELRKVAEYVGIGDQIPRYTLKDLPVVQDEPLFIRDYNLCIGCTRCVRICNDVRGVGALSFTRLNGEIIVGTIAPTLKDSGCRFCGACVEVCPTGALLDKGITWAERETHLIPCKNACPAGVDVPRYIRLIAEGKFAEAIEIIREEVPFPATLGRVCPHPCEDVCRRADLDDAINIKELKRFAAEHDRGLEGELTEIPPKTGKSVAIVGSGPAGMTCGYYLSKLGHQVTIFEALPEPGGMLRYGIPDYRLPKEVIEREIEEIRKVGVNIKTNTKVESLDEIFEQGFDAIFLAMGMSKGKKLGIEGEDSLGVIDGISFLRDVKQGKMIKLGQKVAVIGGGNVAVDAARTALRLGAKDVHILYRRSRAEMPAYAEEVEQALDEGVNINFLVMPYKISKKNGKLSLECFHMELGKPDLSGRRQPIPIKDKNFSMDFDNVIVAIGQRLDIPERFDLSLSPFGTLEVDSNTFTTSRKGVFAGGDMVSGPATVIEAIAMGKRVAQAIDQYLGGQGMIEEKLIETERPDPYLGRDEGFASLKRVEVPILQAEERSSGFKEVILGYTEEQAIEEAKRCLRCDLRLQISHPILPPEELIEFNAKNLEDVPETEGVFQLFDGKKNLIYIKGTMNLFQELNEQLRNYKKARYFMWEEDPMFSKRESELLQQFVQQHGRLPEGNSELDDLY